MLRTPLVGSAWTAYTFGAGLAMLALAVSYVVGPDDVTAWLLVVVGAVVLRGMDRVDGATERLDVRTADGRR